MIGPKAESRRSALSHGCVMREREREVVIQIAPCDPAGIPGEAPEPAKATEAADSRDENDSLEGRFQPEDPERGVSIERLNMETKESDGEDKGRHGDGCIAEQVMRDASAECDEAEARRASSAEVDESTSRGEEDEDDGEESRWLTLAIQWHGFSQTDLHRLSLIVLRKLFPVASSAVSEHLGDPGLSPSKPFGQAEDIIQSREMRLGSLPPMRMQGSPEVPCDLMQVAHDDFRERTFLQTTLPKGPSADQTGEDTQTERGGGVNPRTFLQTTLPKGPSADQTGEETQTENGGGVNPRTFCQTTLPKGPSADQRGEETQRESGGGVNPRTFLQTTLPKGPSADQTGEDTQTERGGGVNPRTFRQTTLPKGPSADQTGEETQTERESEKGKEVCSDGIETKSEKNNTESQEGNVNLLGENFEEAGGGAREFKAQHDVVPSVFKAARD
uniref:Uncharacterized protein n=1 Tax=Chromera velia CCMP2878 TaxID=1169474 RepID=A0A0G4HLC4_9ALVE|eukprot:Cvel_7319.t1-p1 / transcript=Cvel_7319.t1 / gene=Cvel_7319 / organism=Chromera_velia_CCMP2878 / gene_product=Muscle M-line assembly protein unc-89, putative / transcript_product=Muscle M-line assembly protein unc-89, putative / location=Cvel_scaffold379:56372-57706(+) / protein_length=445 / sequence_SO=supercontig / SO=protein_coding / is_pseudo=false